MSYKDKDGIYAVIDTAKGNIVVELEFQKAPMTVANFIGLVEGELNFENPGENFYQGLNFHRGIDNFMIQGGCRSPKDIPPYIIAAREPITYAGINLVGLRRRGFDSDVIRNIKDIYDMIYFQGYNFSDAIDRIEAGFPDSVEKKTILDFIRNSKRGIVRAGDPREKGGIE